MNIQPVLCLCNGWVCTGSRYCKKAPSFCALRGREAPSLCHRYVTKTFVRLLCCLSMLVAVAAVSLCTEQQSMHQSFIQQLELFFTAIRHTHTHSANHAYISSPLLTVTCFPALGWCLPAVFYWILRLWHQRGVFIALLELFRLPLAV